MGQIICYFPWWIAYKLVSRQEIFANSIRAAHSRLEVQSSDQKKLREYFLFPTVADDLAQGTAEVVWADGHTICISMNTHCFPVLHVHST